MTHGARLVTSGMLWAFLIMAGPVAAQTFDFESVPGGSIFGSPTGNVPGEQVLTQAGITMSVESFRFGSFNGFFDARVGGIYADQFPTRALQLNNISVLFDFSALPFLTDEVTFEFLEFGGMNNLAVNHGSLFQLASLNDVPSQVAPGVTASVDAGVVTLEGAVGNLLIGGQELAIDNITAVPEPSTIALLAAGAVLLARRRP